MSIIIARPPNYAEILKVFPAAARGGVIFAYEPNIYAPGGSVPPAIIAHEEVHFARQRDMGVELWWELYLVNIRFRYEEELLAHQAEYRFMIGSDNSRPVRRHALKTVAKKLSAPLYGGLVSMQQAMEDLQA